MRLRRRYASHQPRPRVAQTIEVAKKSPKTMLNCTSTAVHGGHAAPKMIWARGSRRRRTGVGDHVVREEHERDAGHDGEGGVQLDAPQPVPDDRLDDERRPSSRRSARSAG